MLVVDDSRHAADNNGPYQMASSGGQKLYGAFLLTSDELGEFLQWLLRQQHHKHHPEYNYYIMLLVLLLS